MTAQESGHDRVDHEAAHDRTGDDAAGQDQPAAAEWEAQYAGAVKMWSGRVNATLADAVSALAPGSSLDVGCGEGADVCWLAARGWDAAGIDLSETAISRAREAAAAEPNARFEVADIVTWHPGRRFDLVTAFFLHTTDDRAAALRAAAALVAPGGRMLVVSHAAMPPWAHHAHPEHAHGELTPDAEQDALALAPGWGEVEISRISERSASGPDGERAVLRDSVLMIRRAASDAPTAPPR